MSARAEAMPRRLPAPPPPTPARSETRGISGGSTPSLFSRAEGCWVGPTG